MCQKKKSETGFIVGQEVQISGQKGTYTIMEGPNRRNEFRLARGSIIISASAELLTSITHSPKKFRRQAQKSPRGEITSAFSDSSSSLDLHGKTVAESEELLEAALESALRRDDQWIDVIHGIGTGALRRAVRKFAEGNKYISRCMPHETNPGITRLYL